MKIYLLSLIFLLANVCFSQENEEREREREEKDSLKYEIEELTITGTRTTKRIIDIPYSVFRVDKKELTYGKKVSAKDLLADVPGLFLQTRYGGSDLRISLRGYGTRSNTGIRGIRILQDNIPVSETDGNTVADEIDFNALGGVEVVKGNISSLYANAPGGVINFLSDLYFENSFIKTSNQAGSFGMKQTDDRIGIKTNDYRFTMSYNYKNVDGFRPHSTEYSNLVNAIYEAYIGKKATLDVQGNYVRSIVKMPGSLTEQEFDKDPLQAWDLAVSQDFKRDTKKGRLAVRFKTYLDNKESNEFELTGFGGIKNLEQTDFLSYNVLNRYTAGSFLRYRNKTKLFKRDNDFNIGFDYAFQSGPSQEFENIGGHKGSPGPLTEDNIGNWGIYFYEQYNIIKKKMDVYISGRYDKFVFTRNLLTVNTGIIDTTRVFEQFTPKIALNFKLTKDIALYSSYGLGFDVPASSEMDNYPLTTNPRVSLNPDLNPQKSNNFEFGLKGNIINKRRTEWFRKALFDITYFNYNIRDEIVPLIVSGKSYFRNAAKSNRSGLEVGFMSEPAEGLELTVNYIYTHFKYKEYDALLYDTLLGQFYHSDFSNNMMPSYPSHMLNFILGYEFEISDKIDGLLQFDCDYVTKMFVDDKNSQSTSPFFYSNPMAGINFLINRINILTYIGVNNIFNKRYVGFININDYRSRFYETGEPRNIYGGINISYKF